MDMPVVQAHSRALRAQLEIWAVGGCLALMFAGSTLPTPLYSLYQRLFGFSELALTLIYAAYVLGNLSALLFLGRLSDQIGRRPMIFIAIALGLREHDRVFLRTRSGMAGMRSRVERTRPWCHLGHSHSMACRAASQK